MEEKRYCGNCFKYKDVSEFGADSAGKYKHQHLRPYCRPCYVEIETRRHYERKLERNPSQFWECDTCDHIVSIKRRACTRCNSPRVYPGISEVSVENDYDFGA